MYPKEKKVLHLRSHHQEIQGLLSEYDRVDLRPKVCSSVLHVFPSCVTPLVGESNVGNHRCLLLHLLKRRENLHISLIFYIQEEYNTFNHTIQLFQRMSPC